MTTVLIGHAAPMTNSEYQAAYTDSRALLLSPRIGNSASVTAFGVFDTYAQDARRSTVDCLGRGLLMLKNLKTDHQRGFDAYARKKGIPEDAMGVHWDMSHLARLEERDQPEHSFWNKTKTPAPAAPTDVALLPAATMDDAATTTCPSQKSPECEETFTRSTSRWLALKDTSGRPSQAPKSCGPCRKLMRQMWNLHSHAPVDGSALDSATMTVAVDLDPDDDYAMADYASRFSEL